MITNRIGLKATADDPEYWGLAGVMTDEMVDYVIACFGEAYAECEAAGV